MAIRSITPGNRNWVIKIKNGSIVYGGKFGEACRRGLMKERLADMAKYNIRWFEFTYKKDYENCLSELKEYGFKPIHHSCVAYWK